MEKKNTPEPELKTVDAILNATPLRSRRLCDSDWDKGPESLYKWLKSREYQYILMDPHTGAKPEDIQYLIDRWPENQIAFEIQSPEDLSNNLIECPVSLILVLTSLWSQRDFNHALDFLDKKNLQFVLTLDQKGSRLLKWIPEILKKAPPDQVFFDVSIFSHEKPEAPSVPEIVQLQDKLFKEYKMTVRRHPARVYLWNKPLGFDEPQTLTPTWELQERTEPTSIKTSVIVPVYNNVFFVSEVIRHILNQEKPKSQFEVILVDDGSSEDVPGEIYNFCRHMPLANIRYLYWQKPIKGLFRAGSARNIGALVARGENLAFLDADILVPPHFLDEVEKDLSDHDLIQFVRHHITPRKSVMGVDIGRLKTRDTYVEEASYWSTLFNCDDWMGLKDFWKYTCTYALCVKRKTFWEVGGITPNYTGYGFEDTDLGYKLFVKEKKFKLNKTVTYHLTRFNETRNASKRWALLKKTARVFYSNFLNPEHYFLLKSLFDEPFIFVRRAWNRRKYLIQASKD